MTNQVCANMSSYSCLLSLLCLFEDYSSALGPDSAAQHSSSHVTRARASLAHIADNKEPCELA